jgi:hypothetical protein
MELLGTIATDPRLWILFGELGIFCLCVGMYVGGGCGPNAHDVMREVVNHNELSATRYRYLDVHNIPS